MIPLKIATYSRDFWAIMRPFKIQQKVLNWFNVWPNDELISHSNQAASIISTFIIFILNLCALISAAVFFIKTVSFNLELSLFAMFPFLGFLQATYGVLFIFLSRHKIAGLFDKLNKIYNASKYHNCHKHCNTLT